MRLGTLLGGVFPDGFPLLILYRHSSFSKGWRHWSDGQMSVVL